MQNEMEKNAIDGEEQLRKCLEENPAAKKAYDLQIKTLKDAIEAIKDAIEATKKKHEAAMELLRLAEVLVWLPRTRSRWRLLPFRETSPRYFRSANLQRTIDVFTRPT